MQDDTELKVEMEVGINFIYTNKPRIQELV